MLDTVVCKSRDVAAPSCETLGWLWTTTRPSKDIAASSYPESSIVEAWSPLLFSRYRLKTHSPDSRLSSEMQGALLAARGFSKNEPFARLICFFERDLRAGQHGLALFRHETGGPSDDLISGGGKQSVDLESPGPIAYATPSGSNIKSNPCRHKELNIRNLFRRKVDRPDIRRLGDPVRSKTIALWASKPERRPLAGRRRLSFRGGAQHRTRNPERRFQRWKEPGFRVRR